MISDVIYPLPTTDTMADLLSTDERFLRNIEKASNMSKNISSFLENHYICMKTNFKRFSTLWAALGAANLSDVAASEGPFTLFAPTNDAFAKVSNYYDGGGDEDDGGVHDLFAKIPEETLAELIADPEALSVILLR